MNMTNILFHKHLFPYIFSFKPVMGTFILLNLFHVLSNNSKWIICQVLSVWNKAFVLMKIMIFTGVNVAINAHTFIECKQATQSVWALDNVTNAKGAKIHPFFILLRIISIYYSQCFPESGFEPLGNCVYHSLSSKDSAVKHIPWQK